MKFLVPVDFNPLASAALEYAAEVAVRADGTLIVMYEGAVKEEARARAKPQETSR